MREQLGLLIAALLERVPEEQRDECAQELAAALDDVRIEAGPLQPGETFLAPEAARRLVNRMIREQLGLTP